MMNFNEVDIFTKVFDDLFKYVGLNHKFMCEVPSSTLNASEEVNTLVSISGDMEGNIMFGYTESIAKAIAAKLIGIETLDEIDFYAKAALTDFFSEFCKLFVHKVRIEASFSASEEQKKYVLLSSNPTYISGDELVGIISRVPSKKIFFKVNGEKLGISYSLE